MRLNSLELIALIIKEKVDLEQHQMKIDERMSRNGQLLHFREPKVWGNCRSIEKWLSHHYVLRKSVVFIVDT